MRSALFFSLVIFCFSVANGRCDKPLDIQLISPNTSVKKYLAPQSTKVTHSDRSIIVLPPTGGVTYLEAKYAQAFCKDGFDVYIAVEWAGMNEESLDLDIHNKLLSLGQDVIDKIIAQIKSPFIGILGTSVGGLHAATAAGRQPRVNAAFVITAGAPVSSIIAYSDLDKLANYRDQRMSKFNFKSIDDYAAELEQRIKMDPLKFQAGLSGKFLGMSIGTSDSTVATEYQLELEKAWNPSVVYRFDNGHLWSIVKTWWFHQHDIAIFFNQAFVNWSKEQPVSE